jgi:hypothetical protein
MKRHALVLLALVLAAPGCGEKGPHAPVVKGVVTYNGQPLTNGHIIFAPTDPTKHRGAAALIQSDGTFTPNIKLGVPGIMPGEYRVAVTSYSADPNSTSTKELTKMKNGGLAVPRKFADITTSGLTVQITEADAAKGIKLELKD